MKTQRQWLRRVIAMSLFLPIALLAQDTGSRSKSFSVSKGGTFEISTGSGDIRVNVWSKNEVHVEAEGIDPDELDRLEMTQSGSTVRVRFRPRWRSGSDARFLVDVPSEFNLDMRTAGGDLVVVGALKGYLKGSTSGGDIKLDDVDGKIEMSTSGGNVRCGFVRGDAELKTSGGDIELKEASGEVEVSTSGGDIDVGNVGKSLRARTSGGDIKIGNVGGEADVSTAGGDIQVGKVSGQASLSTAGGDIGLQSASGKVSAKTAGGDIHLRDITGSIEARTAGGDVEAELIPSGKGRSSLKSAGGDVKLYVPEDAKATIEATIDIRGWGSRKKDYSVRSDFKADTYDTHEDEIHAVYKLNGGGDLITLETVNANIEIRKLRR